MLYVPYIVPEAAGVVELRALPGVPREASAQCLEHFSGSGQ